LDRNFTHLSKYNIRKIRKLEEDSVFDRIKAASTDILASAGEI